jgi:uncharacterized protein YkwD
MYSAPHRANILNGGFQEIGIGAVTGYYRLTMYTVDFGTRR